MEERRVVIILVAQTLRQELFYLTNTYTRQELQVIRQREQFFCPTCQASLQLKIGHIKIPHFAHKTLSTCDQFSEPESSLHLHGKSLLHDFFNKLNFYTELEKYLPSIRQRADLMIDQRYAIEFQCSVIPVTQLIQRSEGYLRLVIHPIWIKGLQKPLTEEITLLRLRAYEIAMVQQKGLFAYLLLFHPASQQFYYHSNLFYVGGNRWVGKTKALHARDQVFPFAVPKPLSKNEFKKVLDIFALANKQYIRNQLYNGKQLTNALCRLCYEFRLELPDVPLIFGIPMLGADCMKEPAVLWQLQLAFAYEKGIEIDDMIASGSLKIVDTTKYTQAMEVAQEYLSFYQANKDKRKTNANLLDNVYDIYCKTVRKLRK